MALPWWSKLRAKLVLSRLPFGYALWQRLGVFSPLTYSCDRYGCSRA